MDSDPVQDYILEDYNKLRTDAAVFNAWPEVRAKLVLPFLDRLKRALQLKKELEEWEFELTGSPFIDSEAEFAFWMSGWKRDYYVCLVFDHYGEEVVFGLRRDADQKRIQDRLHSDELLAAVKERYQSARRRTWWEARVVMPPPSTSDWRKPEVLWRMRDENGEFLNEVVEQLLEVAIISAPFVDQLVGKK